MSAASNGFGRRGLLAATVGALVAPAPDVAHAEPPDQSGATSVPLFTALPTIPNPNDIDGIQTTGRTHPGVGAARYVATKATGATPYRTRTANRLWFELPEPWLFTELSRRLGSTNSNLRS